MFRSLAVGVLLASGLTVMGCASPDLSRIPETYVDRSPLMPAGVSSWRLLSTYGGGPLTVFPLYWDQGLSENVTLVWFPLPFEAKVRVVKTDTLDAALSLNILGATYFRADTFDWAPWLKALGRLRVSRNFVVDADVGLTVELRRTDPAVNPTLGFGFHPVWQWGHLATALDLGLLLEWNAPRGFYLGTIPAATGTPSLRGPLGVSLYWMALKQWELEGRYTLLGLGYTTTAHQGSLSVRHWW